MLAQTPWNSIEFTGTAFTDSLANGENIKPSLAIAYGTRPPPNIDVCNVPSDDSISPTVNIATATPVARLAISPPKNLLTTTIATEESAETDAIAVGSST